MPKSPKDSQETEKTTKAKPKSAPLPKKAAKAKGSAPEALVETGGAEREREARPHEAAPEVPAPPPTPAPPPADDTAAKTPAAAPAPMPILQSPPGRRFKPPKPPLPAGTLEIVIARAKYTGRHMTAIIEVERPRKRDPKNPRVYKFSLRGCEVARKHLSGRSITLADAAELLKAVKVPELDALEGEARRQATKFLLVALSSRNEAELSRDGDLILVRVPFNAADLA